MSARLIVCASALLAGCASEPTPPAALYPPVAQASPPAPAMPPPAKEARRANGPGSYSWSYRCQGCHDPATPGAPTLARLETYRPETIVAVLMVGKMKIVSGGMSETEARDIAAWITSEVIPQKGSMPAAWP